MKYTKILITGATGFIGSRLCEKFRLQYGLPYRALVRNFSRAARIARLGTEMVAGNLADPASLEAALNGCDGVVHLGFGSAGAAEHNLLRACRQVRLKRFVHISSMAVHGPNPGPHCAEEATATIGRYDEEYSDAKARAEITVQRAFDRGLPGVILRPTIVYGPHGPFVTRVVEAARRGTVSLIDGGKGVCNAVYVDDVCDAIYAALMGERALGCALFINADSAVSWREYNLTFANMVSPPPQFVDFPGADVRAHWAAAKPSIRTNLAALKRLITSAEFQAQLETVPALRAALRWGKRTLMKILSADQVATLRNVEGSYPAEAASEFPDYGRLVREDFHLEFSNKLAQQSLDWQPAFDFRRGAEMTRHWLEFAGLLQSTA